MSIQSIRVWECLASSSALALATCDRAGEQIDGDGGTECSPCIDPELEIAGNRR
ncbi:MAG: hypothetical protein WAU39_14765 [Polyangiales bacterium]